MMFRLKVIISVVFFQQFGFNSNLTASDSSPFCISEPSSNSIAGEDLHSTTHSIKDSNSNPIAVEDLHSTTHYLMDSNSSSDTNSKSTPVTKPTNLHPKTQINTMTPDTLKKEVFIYTHDTAISTAAKIMKGSSEFVGLRFGIEKLVESGAYPKFAYLPPPFIFSKKEVNTLIFQKRKVWTIKPKSAKKQVILYLHGGGYVANLSLVHWDFIQEIIQKTNSILVVPDYPLSPDFTYKDLYEFMDELYFWIIQAYPEHEIIFMGDSAGGGLSLAYAQYIQNRNLNSTSKNTPSKDSFLVEQHFPVDQHFPIEDSKLNEIAGAVRENIASWKTPQKIILLSPWLDLGMKNKDAKAIAELDKILSFEVLNLCSQAYLGNKNPTEDALKLQQVSPIYGPLLENVQIALFVGTHDLFWADSKKLTNQYADYAKSDHPAYSGFQFYEYPQMFHVWMLFTKLPESQSVIAQIADFLNN